MTPALCSSGCPEGRVAMIDAMNKNTHTHNNKTNKNVTKVKNIVH